MTAYDRPPVKVSVRTAGGDVEFPGNTVCQFDDGLGIRVVDLSRVNHGQTVWLIGANVWGEVLK